MTLVRLNNWIPEMSNIMNNLVDRSPLFDQPTINSTIPSVNIYETDDDFQIEVAAPGYKKKDFSIEVENNTLTLSAKKETKGQEELIVRKRQFNYESFERSFTLPKSSADDSKVKASYIDGILTISIAKKEAAKPKPARVIEVA